jgi:hypothetical protein
VPAGRPVVNRDFERALPETLQPGAAVDVDDDHPDPGRWRFEVRSGEGSTVRVVGSTTSKRQVTRHVSA